MFLILCCVYVYDLRSWNKRKQKTVVSRLPFPFVFFAHFAYKYVASNSDERSRGNIRLQKFQFFCVHQFQRYSCVLNSGEGENLMGFDITIWYS